MNEWRAARNILAVRLDNIGDVVMLGPALRAVKETSPAATITLLASPGGTTAAPLLPWVDDVITLRPVWQDVGGHITFDPDRERRLIDQLAAEHFDAALIFTSFSQTPHVPGYLCYLAGIALRVGESREFGGSTLTTELRSAPDSVHQVERNLRLVEQLGFVARDRDLIVWIDDAAREHARQLVTERGIDPAKPFVLLHPGASATARRYPAESSGQVARLLRDKGWPVLVTGTQRDEQMLGPLHAAAPDVAYLLSATLSEFAAVIALASLVIANNTLPLHLADAVGTPVLATYSGTDLEAQWQPRRTRSVLLRQPTPCYPCYLFDCPIGLLCLDIAPTTVVTMAETLLASSRDSETGS